MENNKEQEIAVIKFGVNKKTIEDMKFYKKEEITRFGKISDFLSIMAIPLHFAPLLVLLISIKTPVLCFLLSIVLMVPGLLIRLISMLYTLKATTRIGLNAIKTVDVMSETVVELEQQNQDLRIALRALTASSDTGEERMKN